MRTPSLPGAAPGKPVNPLAIVIAAQDAGVERGITSICSANPFVLEACFTHAGARGLPLLVESTCNQVNQYGGYTGQTPLQFMETLQQMAARREFPGEQLIVGGDHLGPNPWRLETAAAAMEKARVLVRDYVRAGYTKLHLDTSMTCADDGPLTTEIVAARAAELAQVAETTFQQMNAAGPRPLYVFGTEVPAPGGVDDTEEGAPLVTSVDNAAETIEATRRAFAARGLQAAWERAIALVVQPGVEYGNDTLYEYDAPAAASLSRFIDGVEGLVFEAHSTDYQTREALRALVRDHFAILKVGPALTFAFREAVFALAAIEEAWLDGRARITLSNIRQVVDDAMLENPVYWRPYYGGDAQQQYYARQYSLSDRIRYYWPSPSVKMSLGLLLANLSTVPIPLPLLSQYMPRQYGRIRESELENTPGKLIEDKIIDVLNDYAYASTGI